MKNINPILLLSIFTSLSLASEKETNVQFVKPNDGYSYVKISKKDTNRIYCRTSKIGKIAYSTNKEISFKSLGKNSYVKLKEVVTTNNSQTIKRDINDYNREAYIPCGNFTYSLILEPSDINAQTIILEPKSNYSKEDMKKAKKLEKENTYFALTNKLIKNAYHNITPIGYSNIFIGKTIKDFNELSLVHVKKYTGNDYAVHEYLINVKQDIENLEEKIFVPHLENPLRIALEKLSNINKNETIRMFVVSNNNIQKYSYSEKMINYIEDKEKRDLKTKSKKVKAPSKKNSIVNTKNSSSELINQKLRSYINKYNGDK